jgi:dTDP-4-amino-4,6-dideoxygalactose transaminase
MIPVTKTFLPPQGEYNTILKEIWESNQIANGGKLHQGLVEALRNYLNVKFIIPTTNGTLPLQIALKSLGNKGEIITTPFSYVATTSSIVWENCVPVFVDIHPEYLTIDETLIEVAITNKTTAILATHVFGNPCNVVEIQKIAEKYNLKVIFDAAHAFGVEYNGRSIFGYGDVSTCSFHATKIFHTGEGGAMFCKEKEVHDELFYRHNFGHNGPLEFSGLGINAKLSELQAGMGLAMLPYIPEINTARKEVVEFYDRNLNFENTKRITIRENTKWNYSYYPVIFKSEENLLKVQKSLNEKNIFPRRYFYPSLNTLNYINYTEMTVSENISKRILCLPLYYGLTEKEVLEITNIINQVTS